MSARSRRFVWQRMQVIVVCIKERPKWCCLARQCCWLRSKAGSHLSMTQDGHESGTTSLISGLRVMSYNILADCLAWEHLRTLYNSQPQSVLRWERRCHLIAQEIAHHQPDNLCLQEVDHFGFFERELGRLGYQGRYLRRTGNRSDGLAMFWRKSAFASGRSTTSGGWNV